VRGSRETVEKETVGSSTRGNEPPRETTEKETTVKPLIRRLRRDGLGFVVLRLKYCPLSRHCA